MATTKKPVAKKGAPKKAATKKAAPKKATRAGSRYGCSDCGIVVLLEEDCGCPTIELMCCGIPMKKKRPAAKK